MKIFLSRAVLALAIGFLSAPADAKGCLKGAAVGGVAGHVAGHHGFIGAAAGCAIGHHEAKKNQKNNADQQPHQ
ncbi:MAG: hypothetical protein J2P55_09105 [Rhizobiales bacterium]|nr:hypothetical protein [Hyphomicrobiales bacterium]